MIKDEYIVDALSFCKDFYFVIEFPNILSNFKSSNE